jgi:xylulokinase
MFLGIDLGTSGLKAAVVRDDGTLQNEAEAAYEVDHPQPGFAQIDPQVWMRALRDVLAQLGEQNWAAVGVAGQMHGVVLVDAHGRACRPAVLWPDRRAESDLGRWRDLPAQTRRRLANPLVAGMAGPILAWMASHDPQCLGEGNLAVQPKDYVRGQLGGAVVGERSDASATLLWDVPADTWAFDVVDAIGLPPQLLPQVVASDHVVGSAHLPRDPALVAGAGDTAAALLGSGGLAPGQVQVNLGSGAQILTGVARPEPADDPVTHLYADAAGAWYGMVALRNGGLAVDRVRSWLGFSWEDLFAAAARTPVGAGGVSMIPYYSGERGAVAGPHGRGAWLGLTDTTTRLELARAAVEGMVFAVAHGIEVLAGTPEHVRMTGGGALNPVVPQLLADVLGAEVHVLGERSASAIGAAMLAASGIGVELPVAAQPPVVYRPASDVRTAYELWRSRGPAAEL